jgi:hypothetical protein
VLRLLACLLCCAAGGVLAQEIDRSPLPPVNPRLTSQPGETAPEPRPAAPQLAEVATAAVAVTGVAGLRPKPRPAGLAVSAAQVEASEPVAPAEVAAADAPDPGSVLASSLRPKARPEAVATKIAALKKTGVAAGLDLSSNPADEEVDLAAVAPPTARERRKKKREAASMQGAVCGVAAIKGQEIAPIGSRVKGCGVEDPVAITSLSGVRLSQTATVDCSIAKALNQWVDEVAQPAFDGKLVEMQVAAHYICRTRNNIKGAKLSEHSKGRAIDISAFVLSSGKALTVEDNFDRLLSRIYKSACPYFRTTLGPGSDGYHENHFHFDTSERSGGSYCR